MTFISEEGRTNPGYEFAIRHAGEDAGRLTSLLDADLQRPGRQGTTCRSSGPASC